MRIQTETAIQDSVLVTTKIIKIPFHFYRKKDGLFFVR